MHYVSDVFIIILWSCHLGHICTNARITNDKIVYSPLYEFLEIYHKPKWTSRRDFVSVPIIFSWLYIYIIRINVNNLVYIRFQIALSIISYATNYKWCQAKFPWSNLFLRQDRFKTQSPWLVLQCQNATVGIC